MTQLTGFVWFVASDQNKEQAVTAARECIARMGWTQDDVRIRQIDGMIQVVQK